jgi:hypothetical protein
MLHMLQLYKNFSSVLDICCKCFIWILNMFHTYVASVCFNSFRRMLHKCFMFQRCVRRVTRRAWNRAGLGGPECVGGMGGASHLGGKVVSACTRGTGHANPSRPGTWHRDGAGIGRDVRMLALLFRLFLNVSQIYNSYKAKPHYLFFFIHLSSPLSLATSNFS